jgi:hypothetical protein
MRFVAQRGNLGWIAICGLCANRCKEQIDHGHKRFGRGPLHPLICHGARLWASWTEIICSISITKITHNRQTFPQCEIAIPDCWDHTVGVNLRIFWRIQFTKATTSQL